ncbi:AbrB/MazE/SpoVT family DNA-binding domain-containing protein [Rhizobium sp. BK376]|uniref:AbrB/MazE/SpoVT family DNA-binding domain-containing protein n=1 Tax=Rhizobium sp. BK376 TaxID=2512149 RepID=UPI00104DB19C|nr:AbrB/MazE/SpoVT family DNA-binding domain-containing protein [Rhizobium sp. BK376]TCR92957.1 putative addiction module antidote [Rhizobium sp. BK376]
MNVTIRKIGNSEGVIIPKELLEQLGVQAGDELDIRVEHDRIYLEPVDKDFARQMRAAFLCMEKYKVALKKLADS